MELYNKRSWYVLAATIIVGFILYFNLGFLSRFAIARFSSKVLGTRVSIGKMVVKAGEGITIAEDIKIYNPRQYRGQSPYAVTIGKVHIDTKELRKGLIIFEKASVEDVEVFLVASEGTSNFAILGENIRKYMDNYRAENRDNDRGAPDVIVDKLNLSRAKVYPIILQQTYVLGQERKIDIEPVEIPDFEMDSIGTATEGVRARWAIAMIWQELTNSIIKSSSARGLLNHLPSHQMNRVMDATKLDESIEDGADKALRTLFGRSY